MATRIVQVAKMNPRVVKQKIGRALVISLHVTTATVSHEHTFVMEIMTVLMDPMNPKNSNVVSHRVIRIWIFQ